MSDGVGSGQVETLPAVDGGRQLAIIVYVLYFLGYFLGLTTIIGVIIAHIKAADTSPVYQSHFRYQIRTFWVGILFGLIGFALLAAKVGILVLVAVGIWNLIRNVKGFVRILDRRPIDNPTTWLF